MECSLRIVTTLRIFSPRRLDVPLSILQVRRQPKLERPILVSCITPLSIAAMTVSGRQGGRMSGGLGTTTITTTTMPIRAGNG
jgi:hypothetical protein